MSRCGSSRGCSSSGLHPTPSLIGLPYYGIWKRCDGGDTRWTISNTRRGFAASGRLSITTREGCALPFPSPAQPPGLPPNGSKISAGKLSPRPRKSPAAWVTEISRPHKGLNLPFFSHLTFRGWTVKERLARRSELLIGTFKKWADHFFRRVL